MKIETLWDQDDGTPWAAFVRGHDQTPTPQQLWDALEKEGDMSDWELPDITKFWLRQDHADTETFYHSKEGYNGAFPVTGVRF